MKTLYIECKMGIAGDMLMGALYELLSEEQKDEFQSRFDSLGLDGVVLIPEDSVKCGIKGTHMKVLIGDEEEEDAMMENTGVGEFGDHYHHHSHEHDEHHSHDHEHHRHDHEHHHDDNGDHHHDFDHDHDHVHHHSHNSLRDITHIIERLDVEHEVREMALTVYEDIAQAESKVHNQPVDHIHFHEVGSLDAIADVVGVSLIMEILSPEKVVISPINLGSGTVKCAHGIVPVPAPATCELIKNIPAYESDMDGELCTPTGAALAKYIAQKSPWGCGFGQMPALCIENTGYGMGKRNYPVANCVRAIIGEEFETEDLDFPTEDMAGLLGNSVKTEEVVEFSCNIDDMTGEELGFAMEKLLAEGALDVWFENITMKKSRPAVKLVALSGEARKSDILKAIFKHTSSIGVRVKCYSRAALERRTDILPTELGAVRVKISHGPEDTIEKYEFDDLREMALKNNLSLREVKDIINKKR